MKNLIKNEKVQKIFYSVLSFVLCLCLTGASVFCLFKVTLLNEGFLVDSLNNSNYYSDLCNEITDDMVDIGNASGLDKSVFEGFIDEVMVRNDIQNYVDLFYSGEKLKVDTTNFEQSLRSAIGDYEAKMAIDPLTVSEDSINYFVKEAAKIYSNNVAITYFSLIQKTALEWSFKSVVYTLVFGCIFLAIGLFIFFTNKWKHRAVKYYSYATGGAGLFMLIVPSVIMVSGIVNKIAILSRSLSDLYTTIIYSVLTDALIVGGAFIIFSVILVVIHNKLRNKVT